MKFDEGRPGPSIAYGVGSPSRLCQAFPSHCQTVHCNTAILAKAHQVREGKADLVILDHVQTQANDSPASDCVPVLHTP